MAWDRLMVEVRAKGLWIMFIVTQERKGRVNDDSQVFSLRNCKNWLNEFALHL